MIDKLNNIIKGAKTFSYTKEEKRLLLDNISSYIEKNKLKNNSKMIPTPYTWYVIYAGRFRHIWYDDLRPRLSMSLLKLRQHKSIPIAVMLLVIMGGGTSYAANFALPGDTLYPIKIYVNENVKSFFAFGANANAKLETELVNERLEEAEKIATSGDISTEAKDKIKQNFNGHANRAENFITQIETKGNIQNASSLNSHLENILKDHRLRLSELSESREKSKNNIDEINSAVDNHLKDISKSKESEIELKSSINIEQNMQEELFKEDKNNSEFKDNVNLNNLGL